MTLEFELPAALGLLAVPAVLLILVRRRHSARQAATGTLPFWRAAADSTPAVGQRVTRALPLGLCLLCGALVAGVLALAGPRTGAPVIHLHRFVLDRSPSMFLPASAGGATRMERALALVSTHLEATLPAGDEVRWGTWDGSAFTEVAGREPPAAWLRQPAIPAEAPPWELVDRASTTWVTDAVPSLERERAGVCASGGVVVPGPVAYHAGSETLWDGSSLTERALPDPRLVALSGRLPAPVADLVRVWSAARGVGLANDEADADLIVSGPLGTGGPSVHAGREAWTARGPAAHLAVEGTGGSASAAGATDVEGAVPPRAQTWLAASDGQALVTWRPGRVSVAWGDPLEVDGDPAAFAVSWSRLLDRALPAPRTVVAYAERQSAGAELLEPAREGALLEAGDRRAWAAWLAALACALALVATRVAA